MNDFTVQMIPLAQLRRAPWNANVVPTHVLAKIKHSLQTYGIVQNLVVRPLPPYEDKHHAAFYEVIGGNHRLDLYTELGLDSAPCVIVDVDDAQARLLSEALNQVHGKDDPELYTQLIRDVIELGTPTSDITRLLDESEESLKRLLSTSVPADTPPLNWQGRYEIVVECEDETQQQTLYQQLTAEGHTCRVLTM